MPVILVPGENDLQVWQNRGAWHAVQSLEGFVSTTTSVYDEGPGYDKTTVLDMNIGDTNGDGRGDIMIHRPEGTSETFAVYLQKPAGLFALEPALNWTGKRDWSWSCWLDINRD